MINNLQGIPFLLLASIVISGLIIYLVFTMLSKYSIAFTKRKADYSFLLSFIAKIKLLVWFLWFVISVYFLLLASPIITIIFLIGLYLFSKDFWKNIYSGVFLKYDDKIKVGDYIFISSIDKGGIINKLLLSDVEIKKDNNELLYIPYSLIINSPILKKSKSGNYFLNDFVLDNKEKAYTEKIIKDLLINCPWTILSKSLDIELGTDGNFRVRAYTFSKETASHQIECVKKIIFNI